MIFENWILITWSFLKDREKNKIFKRTEGKKIEHESKDNNIS